MVVDISVLITEGDYDQRKVKFKIKMFKCNIFLLVLILNGS